MLLEQDLGKTEGNNYVKLFYFYTKIMYFSVLHKEIENS